MTHRLIQFCYAFILCLPFNILAQELPEIVPPSPEAASFAKFSEIPISHYTGVPNISVPISSYRVGEKSFPVEISYHARGIRVDEIASRVGLGWALNAGGQITRQVRHKADDGFTGYGNVANTHALVFANGDNPNLASDLATRFLDPSDYDFDKIPDLFTLQGGGLSTKFIFNYADGKPLVQKYDDIIVEHRERTGPNAYGIAGFIVTDKDGYKYYYGIDSFEDVNGPVVADVDWVQKKYTFKADQSYILINPEDAVSFSTEWTIYPYFNTWHLTEVISPNGDRARFIYNKETNYLYRRTGDKYIGDLDPEDQLQNYTDVVRIEQYQLEEIQYNFDANGDYTKIVFEANDQRSDLHTIVHNDGGVSSGDTWPSEGKELDAIKIYEQSHTYDDNGETVTDYVLNKTFNLSHHYEESDDHIGPRYNFLPILGITMNPSARNRLVLDAVTEVGKDGTTKPPYTFTYDPTKLPNRHSNSQDYWGYYNGADNGSFLVGYGLDRRVNTVLSQAGMLKQITYPTGGSTRFTYEHNRGFKGSEYDDAWLPGYQGISLPRINPGSEKTIGLSSMIAYAQNRYHPTGGIDGGGFYATEAITVNTPSEFRLGNTYILPFWGVEYDDDMQEPEPVNQMEACIGLGGPYETCKFRVLLRRVMGDEGEEEPVPGIPTIMFWTDSPPTPVGAGKYRLEVHPPSNWVPDATVGDPDFESFHVSLSWDDQVADEDTVLYAAGKRIKQIEYLDENNNIISKKTYNYNDSGAILGISDFSYNVILNLGAGAEEISFEPYHLYNTYQGNTIGYQLVDEYYGDKDNNYGKRRYQFLVPRDTGDFIANPLSPPTDNEWLRGLPRRIIDYKGHGDGSYTKVKQIDNEYLVANDHHINVLPSSFQTPNGVINPILTPETQFYSYDPVDPEIDPTEGFPHNSSDLPDIFYEKTRTNFRLPFVFRYTQAYIHHSDILPRDKIKIFHFTGGTLDTYKTTETLFGDNGLPTLITTTTNGFNYDNHYQPTTVTTVTSDGEPVIQTMTYAQDLLSATYLESLEMDPENPNPQTVEDHLDVQHRITLIETKTYKDRDNDALAEFNELTSTSKTVYDWVAENTILAPELVQTSKGGNALEDRIEFKKYNAKGKILEVSKTEGTSIIYVWGYKDTQPIAKIENASYDNLTPAQQSAIDAVKLASDNDIDEATEATLRTALENLRQAFPYAMVSTYTYDSLVGVTSTTDPRGYTSYYEYDDFNRLKLVKDQDGNILNQNEYNYGTQN
ncbi:hypothetical protein [Winogradskyella sp.]|uniref:hypothetical protein n=1 Tax=Winogradskyella sp. TaxID=1883156 RepID=UPI0026132450|nr:hypothetical protein [Winogradskyella sp.]